MAENRRCKRFLSLLLILWGAILLALPAGAGAAVYIAGNQGTSLEGYDFLTIKYDVDGHRLWARRYNGPSKPKPDDRVKGLAVDGAGNVYVTGASRNLAQNDDFLTIKYDAAGQRLWVRRYNGPANLDDQPYGLAVDGAGNVYVAGSSGNGSDLDYLTVKYDKTGKLLWARRYNSPAGPVKAMDYASAMAVDWLGNVYVTGSSNDSDLDFLTVKYDTAGTLLWERRYNSNSNDWVLKLVVDEAGNVFVVGIGHTTSSGIRTLKYDAAGTLLWDRCTSGSRSEYPTALAVDGAGNVIISAISDNGKDRDYLTLKYDTAGNLLWERHYNGPAKKNDYTRALGVDEAGNIYVTGYSEGHNYPIRNYLTIKYDAGGHRLWARRYPSNSSDFASALAVDVVGNVYVTGASEKGNGDISFLTIKYDSTGHRLWVRRYKGPGYPVALVVED